MTPLTKLLVESREEFATKFSRFIVKNDNIGQTAYPTMLAFQDSLIRKAYLLGLERAKSTLPMRQGIACPECHMPTDIANTVIEHIETALDSAIGEAEV